MGKCELDSSGSGYGLVMGSCGQGNEAPENFLTIWLTLSSS
jgi:hypothetical protein